ncbi:MAG: efflux RND transporter periplasmic adaptor subunit [Gammaproteobacteria bacterium]
MFATVFRSFLLIITLLAFVLPAFAVVPDDDEGAEEAVKTAEGGMPSVHIDQEKQQLSGLQVMTVLPADYQAEFAAYGKAVSVQPLLALRSQYRVALSEQLSADARLAHSGQSIRRTEELYRHGVAAKRIVQEQQSLWQTDKAQLAARRAESDAVLEAARLNWGERLTDWAVAAEKDALADFVSGKDILVLVTLPAGKALSEPVSAAHVDPDGNRSQAQTAAYISPAPQIDQAVQGASYFFRTSGKKIRPGMNVSVWLPDSRSNQTGVIIPRSALIWSMDQAFVYVKTGQDTFSRRLIDHYAPAAEGYFVRDALQPGEQIVTVGGQMLLSEEFRAQIPDEDD